MTRLALFSDIHGVAQALESVRAAIARAKVALDDLIIEGVTTNRDFHRALLDHEAFREAKVTTALLDRVGAAAFLRGPHAS